MMKKDKYSIKNTLGMYDLIKGVVMILVILGHTYGLFDEVTQFETPQAQLAGLGAPRLLFDMLFALMLKLSMPLLFIISGYGFRKVPFKKCISNQFKRIMEPYIITALITTVLHFFVQLFMLGGGLRYSLVETFRGFLGCVLGMPSETYYFGHLVSPSGPIWFMIALFIGIAVFDLLVLHFDGVRLMIASALVSCLGWLLSLGITLPWSLSQGLVSVLFICLGYLAKKNKLFTSELTVKKIITMIAVGIPTFFVCMISGLNLSQNEYEWGPLTIISVGLLGLILTYWFLHLNRFNGKVSAFIRWIGRMSLYVICVHSIEISSVGLYIQYDFVTKWQGSIFVRSMIIFGVRLVVVLAVTYIFVKLKDFYMNKRKNEEGNGNG